MKRQKNTRSLALANLMVRTILHHPERLADALVKTMHKEAARDAKRQRLMNTVAPMEVEIDPAAAAEIKELLK